MSQDTVLIDVPFGQGINEKLDATVLPNGVLATCENATFDKLGALHKRNGFTSRGKSLVGGGSLGAVSRLVTYGNELVAFDGHNINGFAPAGNVWTAKDQAPEPDLDLTVVAADASGLDRPVVGENAGYRVYAWEHNSGGGAFDVYALVVSAATGEVLIPTTTLDTGALKPQIVNCGQYIFVTWTVGANIHCRRFDTASPGSGFAARVTIVAANYVSPNGRYDVCALDATTFLLGYYRTTGASIARVDSTGTLTSETVTAENPTNCITVFFGNPGDTTCYLAWHNGAGVRIRGFNPTTLVASWAVLTVNATAAPIADQIAIGRPNAPNVLVIWSQATAAAAKATTFMRPVTTGGAITGVERSHYGIRIISKPFLYDSHMYMLTQNTGYSATPTTQSTLFLVDLDIAHLVSATNLCRVVVAARAGTTFPRGTQSLSAVPVGSATNLFTIAAPVQSRNGLALADQVAEFAVDMNSATRWQTLALNNDMITTGGVTMGYDGERLYELGFFLYPEFIVTGQANSFAGFLPNGTYGFAVVFEWTDRKGNRTQSIPAFGQQPLAGANDTVVFNIPQLNITNKSDFAVSYTHPVTVSTYMTEVNKDVYYLIDQRSNDPTSAILLNFSKSTPIDTTAPQLYTGGPSSVVLSNGPVPASKLGIAFSNRAWIVPSEDRTAIRYSKEAIANEGVAFNEGLEFRIDRGGEITALAILDDKLIVFKDAAIFVVVGQGATDTGQGDSLSASELHTDGVGAVDWRSVTKVPDGLVFLSKKGIYKLDRSLQLSYIGANAEDSLNSSPSTLAATITSAVALDNGRRVLFTARRDNGAGTVTGNILALDTLTGQWSNWLPSVATSGGTKTNVAWSAAVEHNGAYTIATDDTSVTNGPTWFYDNSTFVDEAAFYVPLHWKTGPLRLAGQQARMRVRHVRVLATRPDPVSFTVTLTRNYGEASEARSTGTLALSQIEQFAIAPITQVCEAMAVECADAFVVFSSGQGYWVSGLQLEVAPIRGAHKLPTSVRV